MDCKYCKKPIGPTGKWFKFVFEGPIYQCQHCGMIQVVTTEEVKNDDDKDTFELTVRS
jgi:hypothetical protein